MNYESQLLKASGSKLNIKQQQFYLINTAIINYIGQAKEPVNAESLWMMIDNEGYKMSISSFYTRLKRLIDAGLIIKIAIGNKRVVYDLK